MSNRPGKILNFGNKIPIVGQKKKKLDQKTVPRFSAEQLQAFLFDIAMGTTHYMAAINLKLDKIIEELGIELNITVEEYEGEMERILPEVMASFGFDTPGNGDDDGEQEEKEE